jgi:LysR family transcriptional regulator, regulator for metE and metH
MNIEIRHLRTLKCLQASNSLVAAAERLHLTQSALSHQIKALEEQLGGDLFMRKTRPLRFTRIGERLLQLADAVLPQIETAGRDIARLSSGQSGRLNIAIECHSCFAWLMPTMDRYRDLWPEIEMDLSVGFNFDPLPALQRGEVDLTITSDPCALPGIRFVPLFRYQALLSMSRDHELVRQNFVQPADLADQTLITYPIAHERLDIFTQFLDPASVKPARVRSTELTVMMMQLVASHQGIAALPNWALAEYLERDYISARPLGPEGMHATLYAAIREEELGMAYMKEFLNTAIEVSFRTLSDIQPPRN